MTTSARRIAVVLATLLGAFAVVIGAFADIMLGDHSIWLERSYRKRWAFRDVPSRRGSILDRNGTPLVVDVSDFAVELDYAEFRREHPVGIAISAASLVDAHDAPGAIVEPTDVLDRYTYAKPGDLDAAVRRVLTLPTARLHGDVSGRDVARDLRFYVYRVGANLSGVSRQEVARRLFPAIRAQNTVSIAGALGVDVEAAVARVRECRGELLVLDEQLGSEGALLRQLDRLRREHTENILARARATPDATPALPPVSIPVLVARGLAYDAVVGLAAFAEQWPGIRARSTVERTMTGARERAPSLLSLFGETTGVKLRGSSHAEERDDANIQLTVSEVVSDADLTTYFPETEGLDDDAARRLESRARSFVRRRLENEGRVGRSGVERVADDILAGQPGLRWVERDARAREQLLYRSLDVAPGMDVHLTIDLRLQELLEGALDAHTRDNDTALVVLDARTGDILALGGRPLMVPASPGADAPLVARRVSPTATWRGTGYIGSLAKPFVLLEQLAAEREGRAHVPRAALTGCAGGYKFIPGTRHKLSCDHVHGAAATDPAYALGHSCNTFFFQLSDGMGIAGLQRAYERAGWCRPDAPTLPDAYQPQVEGVPGMARSELVQSQHVVAQMGIGYGLEVNAIMVARAYAALATGMLPSVGLVQELARPAPLPLGIPRGDLELVHAGLRACVVDGTAGDVSGLAELGVHGKTGTAEVTQTAPRLNNAWFAGFVLAANGRPTLAFAAVAYKVDDHGKDSAGMVRDFLRAILTHPDGDLRRRWLDGLDER